MAQLILIKIFGTYIEIISIKYNALYRMHIFTAYAVKTKRAYSVKICMHIVTTLN